jgi:hypothetical protein
VLIASPTTGSVVMSDRPDQGNEFGLVSATLGGLPIVNLMLDRLGLPAQSTR